MCDRMANKDSFEVSQLGKTRINVDRQGGRVIVTLQPEEGLEYPFEPARLLYEAIERTIQLMNTGGLRVGGL